MGLSIKLNDASFSLPNLPTAVPVKKGFVLDSLKSLYLFNDSNPATQIVDEMGIANTALQTSANAHTGHSVLSNGGLRIRGLTRVVGPQIDLSAPFTMMFAGRFNVPDLYTGSGYAMASLSIDQYETYYQRGFVLYDLRGSVPTPASALSLALRPANKGAQDGINTRAIPANSSDKFGLNIVQILRHEGGGNYNFQMRSLASVADVDFYTTLPYPQIATNSGNVINPVVNSAINVRDPIWQATDLNLESFAIYTKAITDSELLINCNTAFSLIASRGR